MKKKKPYVVKWTSQSGRKHEAGFYKEESAQALRDKLVHIHGIDAGIN